MSYQAKKLFQDNELAKRYSKFRYVFPKKLVSEIMKLLDNKKPCLWVDVACGPGNSTEQIFGNAEKIIGIDISPDQIRYAKEGNKHPNVSFDVGSCYEIPAADVSVDVITVIQAVHYFDIPKFLKEVDRALKPGGVLGLCKMATPGTCISSPTFEKGVNALQAHFFKDYGISESMKIWINDYIDIETLYEPRYEFRFSENIQKSYSDLIDVYSTFSHFNNLMNDNNLSFEEGLDYITKYMDKNGVTEEDKLKEHTFRMDSFMLAFQKPL